MRSRPNLSLALALLLLSACQTTVPASPSPAAPAASPASSPAPTQAAADDIPGRMRRGINLGNALEAPREGEWGLVIQEEYFDLIKQAGFDFVRIPIRWGAHAGETDPYTIDPAFTARIDQVTGWALQRGLVVVLNVHHYAPQTAEVAANPERLISIWMQIALHYQDVPPEVVFELFNEPDNSITAAQWNEIAAQILEVVRESNPSREAIIGGVFWNAFDQLQSLRLPSDDPHLIATFHYYLPFEFTHQGAEWVEGSNAWLGRSWQRTPAQRAPIQAQFEAVAQWAEANNLPVLVGEFGAYSKADSASRALWTAFVREQAEQHGFSWAYWEFGAGFGVYDPQGKRWNQPIREALLPE